MVIFKKKKNSEVTAFGQGKTPPLFPFLADLLEMSSQGVWGLSFIWFVFSIIWGSLDCVHLPSSLKGGWQEVPSRAVPLLCVALPYLLPLPSDTSTEVGMEELSFILLSDPHSSQPKVSHTNSPELKAHLSNSLPDVSTKMSKRTNSSCPKQNSWYLPPTPRNFLFPIAVNDVLPMAQVKNFSAVCDSPSSHPHIKSIRHSSSDCSSAPLQPHPWPSIIRCTPASWPLYWLAVLPDLTAWSLLHPLCLSIPFQWSPCCHLI